MEELGSLDEGVEERGGVIPTVIDVPEVFSPHIEVTLLRCLGVSIKRPTDGQNVEVEKRRFSGGRLGRFQTPFFGHLQIGVMRP